MPKKIVKMTLSANGYKNFKMFMKKMKFRNEDWFLRYCTMNTVKAVATPSQKRQLSKEMGLIKNAEMKKK